MEFTMDKGMSCFISVCILLACTPLFTQVAASEVTFTSYPVSGQVKLGDDITLKCTYGEIPPDPRQRVVITRTVGTIQRDVVGHEGAVEGSLMDTDRYAYNTAIKNQRNEAKLVISDARTEDIGLFKCRTTDMSESVTLSVAVCEDVKSKECDCIKKNGQILSSCFEKADDVKSHYKRITTGLIVCIVLVALVCVVLAFLVGKDCLDGVYKKHMGGDDEEDDQRPRVARSDRQSKEGAGGGGTQGSESSGRKGLVYRGLGRASLLGRRKEGYKASNAEKYSESAHLNVEDPDCYSNNSSYVEMNGSRRVGGGPGEVNRAYTPDHINDSYRASTGGMRTPEVMHTPDVHRAQIHHNQPTASTSRSNIFTGLDDRPNKPRPTINPYHGQRQLNAATSDITKADPISVIGKHTGACPKAYPGTRGNPEGKSSSVASDLIEGGPDPHHRNPPLDMAQHSGGSTSRNGGISRNGDVYGNHKSRAPKTDWLSKSSGWHSDPDEDDPSMDIDSPPAYTPRGENVVLTPASLGNPRTPPNAIQHSPRGAYSEAPPPKRGDTRAQGYAAPRQLSYEDKNKWDNQTPFVSSGHSNV